MITTGQGKGLLCTQYSGGSEIEGGMGVIERNGKERTANRNEDFSDIHSQVSIQETCLMLC